MHGLNLYDYSARYYESAIGRFTTVDPMAEMYYSISPYAYVGNNPIIRTDPTGMVHVDGKDRINPLTATKEELREYLDVDSLEFLSVESLVDILGSPNHCFGCFTEKYPVNKPE